MFDWREYHQLATDLLQRGSNASLRSAISRAYYAADGRAAHDLIDKHVLESGDINHEKVWRAFAHASHTDRQNINSWGFSLKDARESADDKGLFPGDLDKKAIESVRLAQRLITTLDRIWQDPW